MLSGWTHFFSGVGAEGEGSAQGNRHGLIKSALLSP